MDRRRFMLALSGGLAATGLTPSPSVRGNSAVAGQSNAAPPNIIFLLTDDQRLDSLGCMGNPIIQTPAVDALAAEGVVFTNAYVTTSICMTSRASIFLGQYASRHGINDFRTNLSPEALDLSYPGQLRQAGYWTGFVGKHGVGNRPDPEAFDYWKGFAGQGHFETQDSEGRPIHLTDLMGDQALAFLEQRPADQPFCLSVSFKAPHVQDNDPRQFIHAERHQDLYADVTIPPPPASGDEYYEAFPEFFRRNNEGRRRWGMRFDTPEKYQEMVKGYYRLITGVDDVVGRIREALARQGLADNTIIVFTSDNGFYLGERGLAGKWWGHEESIRIPLVVYDPRLPASARGRRVDQMALNIDMAPTMLDMAGLKTPEAMQGRSLLPLIQNVPDGGADWRDDFLYEHHFRHGGIPRSEGVVSLRWKYLRYPDAEPVYEQLFDLDEDPHEIRNLAQEPEHRERLEAMRQRWETLREAAQ